MSRKQRKPYRSALRLERLEDRRCLAASMGLADHGHTLVIEGDRSDNQIAIVQDVGGVRVVADDVARSFTGIDRILVDTGAGNDTVNYGATSDPNVRRADLRVRLGAGNDTFEANLIDPPSPDRPVTIDPPSPDRIAVDAGAGDDTINTSFSSLPTALSRAQMPHGIDLILDGSAGDDVVQNTMRNLNLNGRVNLNLNGGVGSDRVAQIFDHVLANAGLDVNLNGGMDEDDLSLLALSHGTSESAFDPAFIANSPVRMRLEGGGGSDQFHADITPSILPQGTLDIIFADGGGDDVFDINLVMELPRKDTTVPYGPMQLTVLGGSGDDQLTLRVANLEDSISPLDIRLVGGGGHDTAEVTPGLNVDHWLGDGTLDRNQKFVRDL